MHKERKDRLQQLFEQYGAPAGQGGTGGRLSHEDIGSLVRDAMGDVNESELRYLQVCVAETRGKVEGVGKSA